MHLYGFFIPIYGDNDLAFLSLKTAFHTVAQEALGEDLLKLADLLWSTTVKPPNRGHFLLYTDSLFSVSKDHKLGLNFNTERH